MSTVLQDNHRELIKLSLMKKLYDKQLEYWNTKLMELEEENAVSLGRQPHPLQAIHFRHRIWRPAHLLFADNDGLAYCLPLNPNKPEFLPRMEEIADALQELEDEKYEVERFISHLVLFAIPPKRYKKILGRVLYNCIAETVERNCAGFSDRDWELNDEFSLKEYVTKNQGVIKRMIDRVMINTVTV